MIWQNAWGWIGALTIALPVLIHLLGRGHARVQPFPSLRFLAPSRLLPARRTRIHDLLLLIVRVAILTVAVAALAQPLLLTTDRTRTLGASLARAIVVDTSTSMLRATPTGNNGLNAARRKADSLAAAATSSIVIESNAPRQALSAAIEWLSRQVGQAEVVVVSDFQLGAMDSSDVAAIPPRIGVRLLPIAVRASLLETRARAGDAEIVARMTPDPERTTVEWTTGAKPAGDALIVLAGSAERARADAARIAGTSTGVRMPMDSAHTVVIVHPEYEQRATLLRTSTALRAPWAADIVARLSADSTLVVAKQATDGRLYLFSLTDAGSLASAALIAAARRAQSLAPPLAELEPLTLTGDVLQQWQRAPAMNASARGSGDASDGRWLWVVALVLLIVESWLRRVRRERVITEVAHDRAA